MAFLIFRDRQNFDHELAIIRNHQKANMQSNDTRCVQKLRKKLDHDFKHNIRNREEVRVQKQSADQDCIEKTYARFNCFEV